MSTSDLVVKTITLNGQTIRTAVRPGKLYMTPLLLFNGIGASIDLVIPFINSLDPDLEVIAFDVPGVGGSSTPLLPYRFTGLASTVVQMLNYLGYGKVNVFGVSWGGFLAQQFAFDHPERCKKLILAATSTGVAMVPPSLTVLGLMSSPRRYTDPEYGARIAPEIYGGSFRNNPELASDHARKMKSSGGIGYYYQMAAVYWWTSIHWLHRIKQPTLVLAGNDDPLIPLVNMKIIANRIPNSELHVIDDGHLFMVTKTEVISPIIMQFLEEPQPAVVNG